MLVKGSMLHVGVGYLGLEKLHRPDRIGAEGDASADLHKCRRRFIKMRDQVLALGALEETKKQR